MTSMFLADLQLALAILCMQQHPVPFPNRQLLQTSDYVSDHVGQALLLLRLERLHSVLSATFTCR